MNRMTLTAAIAALALTCSTRAADTQQPGFVDFGTFAPPSSGGSFVEVNIGKTLISLASRMIPEDEPEVSRLLNGLHLIRVNVVGIDDSNRADLEKRAKDIRSKLDKDGWERVVAAIQQDRDVGLYIKAQGEDAIAGLAMVVIEPQAQAVFINVVGNIRPEQLAMVGERMNIEQLKRFGPPPKQKTEAKDSTAPEKKSEAPSGSTTLTPVGRASSRAVVRLP
ncbi:MAG TPA: DUF4252 domain-containing protein [Verrucomicrobia bacterium]|nr:DUF4252 domain-containing protein [Verrucomicrobiota bacterium]HOB33061.1 DUF4252 domain-containing protein [Verrucomicrobiota bacterium]HOP97828.1 DUF4252 domain-containing protein [Verrucomicrobiota bacterium]HPU57149.1 DUF4252 domain-containing protein [Verrucomicrobiota bacterium]